MLSKDRLLLGYVLTSALVSPPQEICKFNGRLLITKKQESRWNTRMAIVKICTKQFLLINLISQATLQICQSKALLVARKPNKTRLVWTIMQRRNITCQKNWKHTHLHLCAACLHNPSNKMLAPQNPKKRMRKRGGTVIKDFASPRFLWTISRNKKIQFLKIIKEMKRRESRARRVEEHACFYFYRELKVVVMMKTMKN